MASSRLNRLLGKQPAQQGVDRNKVIEEATETIKTLASQKPEVGKRGPIGPKGNDGVSIIDVKLAQSGELIVFFSNGTSSIAGVIKRGHDGRTFVPYVDFFTADEQEDFRKKITKRVTDWLLINIPDFIPAPIKGDALKFSDLTESQKEELKGEKGDKPKHEISGNNIRFEKPDGSWGEWIKLSGGSSSSYANIPHGGGATTLKALTDVDLSGLTIVDGKYVLGSSAWGSITGTITDQSDLVSYISDNLTWSNIQGDPNDNPNLINTIENIAQNYATQWTNVTGGIQYGSKVGIGSGATAPAYSLHIATTGQGGFAVNPAANPSFGLGSPSSPLSYWAFTSISGQNQIDTTNRPFLIKATSFADMFFLDATSGKMALGTQTVSTGWLNMRPTSGRGLYIRPNGYDFGDTSNQAIMLENNAGTHRAQWSQRASDMTFGTLTNQPLYFSQNASAIFQMLTDGNVNICRETVPGSTNGWRLRVMHRETTTFNARKSTLSLFADASADTTTGFGPSMEFGGRMGATSGVQYARIDSLLSSTGADLVFSTHNGTSITEAMSIQGDNNIKINTSFQVGPAKFSQTNRVIGSLYNIDTNSTGSTAVLGFQYLAAPSSASSANGIGVFADVGTFSTANNITGFLQSFRSNFQGRVNSTLAAYYGFGSNIAFSAAVTGTITNAFHFHANTPGINSGNITDLYGFYISAQKSANVTRAWGIYQVGSDDVNYFNGNSGFGTNTPSEKVHVVGNALVTGTISGRQKARVYSVASTSTLTPEISTYDAFTITALAANLTIANHSTSTPNDFDEINIRILDNGTARAITFGTNYVAGNSVSLPTTTVISTTMNLKFRWDSTKSKFVLLAKD